MHDGLGWVLSGQNHSQTMVETPREINLTSLGSGRLRHDHNRRASRPTSRPIILSLSASHWLRKTLMETTHALAWTNHFGDQRTARLSLGRGSFLMSVLSSSNYKSSLATTGPSPFIFHRDTGAQVGFFSKLFPSLHSNSSWPRFYLESNLQS